MALKAIVTDLNTVAKEHRDLYAKILSGPLEGRFRLQVDEAEGFTLSDKSEAERWKTHATKILVDDAINQALAKVGVDAEWRDHFFDELKARTRLAEDGGNLTLEVLSGKELRMNARGQPMTVEELAEATRRDHPRCFGSSSGKSSTGSSNGYAGKNPFAKESFSLTEQGKLFQADRATYDRLKAEAASASGGTGPTRNPFSKKSWNLTEQGKLLRENPALYERMKAEAEAAA